MDEDTVKLLKACNAGCKTATRSMEQVLPYIDNEELGALLEDYDKKHIAVGEECRRLLNEEGEEDSDPSGAVRAMTSMVTEMRLLVDDSTERIAEFLMDGCYRGIKSVSGYCNQYRAASPESTRLAHRLIETEEIFMKDLRPYL